MKLKIGSKIRINEEEFVVEKTIDSEDLKEYFLDKKGEKYLLQFISNSSPELWKIKNSPITGKKIFGKENLIKINSIKY